MWNSSAAEGTSNEPIRTRPATITNQYCGQGILQAGFRMTSKILARKRSTKQTEQFSVFYRRLYFRRGVGAGNQ
jgi:hypothetical protein